MPFNLKHLKMYIYIYVVSIHSYRAINFFYRTFILFIEQLFFLSSKSYRANIFYIERLNFTDL
jgi:hypothetical protein